MSVWKAEQKRRQQHVNPQMSTNWFALDRISKEGNPEIARRQLRHKNIDTTMKTCDRVNDMDLANSIPSRPTSIIATKPKENRNIPYLQVVS